MRVRCDHCSELVRVEDRLAGRRVKCSHCDGVFVAKPDDEPIENIAEFLEAEPSAWAGKSTKELTTCPMCGAKNAETAEECRACGEPLTPQRAGKSLGVWRDGNQLVMDKDAELPYRCIKTNGEADLLLRRKLSWHHPVVYVTLLAGLLIYVILAVVLSKRADIRVPICHAVRRRRILAILIGWSLGLTGFGVMIVGIGMAGSREPQLPQFGILVVITGIVVALVSAVAGLMLAAVVTPAKITDRHVWLKGVNPDYLDQLREWPGEDEVLEGRRPRQRRSRAARRD